jgi:hypothetical protein
MKIPYATDTIAIIYIYYGVDAVAVAVVYIRTRKVKQVKDDFGVNACDEDEPLCNGNGERLKEKPPRRSGRLFLFTVHIARAHVLKADKNNSLGIIAADRLVRRDHILAVIHADDIVRQRFVG